MPWMLLNEPRRPPRTRPGKEDGAADDGATSRNGSVWIVIGGLDRALVQAGMIGRLLEAGPRPASIIASGFGVANALLIAGARRETFERRWEHLRASRFLVSAAFGSVRWFGALNGMFDDLAALLAEIAQAKQTR